MPSTSAKQHKFMEAIAHNSAFAKKVGVKQSVGKDFAAADKGKTFSKGMEVAKTKNVAREKAAAAMIPLLMKKAAMMRQTPQMPPRSAPMGPPGAVPMKKGGKAKKGC
jgi:hypothetical protein